MGPPPSGLPTRLVLSDGERGSYRRLADTLLKTALREYAAFCMDNPARRVSSLDWKLVKSQDSVSVYKARHPPTARKDAPFEQRLLTPEGRFERVDTNISVPTMLVTGTMRGTVDDAVHGAFVDGPESHATRGYYIHDRSTDFRVLARIDEPTESDPHRFCGIAWTEMGGAGVPFVKRRDLLTLVVSGVATVPGTSGREGDRIGYYIVHSISHPQVRSFTEHKLLRAKCSFSYLFSQQHPHGVAGGGVGSHVETYQKGFFAPLGDVPERGVVSAVVRTLICPSRLVDAGYNRKLSFLLQHAPPTRAPRQKKHREYGHGADDHGDTTDDDDEDSCAGGCAKRRSDSFFSSSGGSPFSRSNGPLRRFTAKPQHHESHGVCVVCKLPVCGACKVTKKLVVDATGYELVVKSLGFCLVCVNKAKTLDAPMLARQELLENRRGFASSPQLAHRPPSAGARMSPDPASTNSNSVRSTPTSNNSVCSPLMDKPRVPRKTWVDASPSSSYSSDDGYAPRVRAASEMPRVERKTSWLGGEVSSSSNNNSTHSEAPRYDRKSSRSGSLSINSLRTTNTGSVAAQTAFDHQSSPVADEQVASSSGAFAQTMRTPPPPAPSRRTSHAPTSLASSTIGETAAVTMPLPVGAPEVSAQRSRVPLRPRHQSWQASSTVNPSGQVRLTHAATVGAPEFIAQRVRAPPPQRPRHQSWQSTDSVRMERAGTSPYNSNNTGSSGTQTSTPLQPTQDKQRQTYTATQPRRRIDERAAIEDITMRGILL